MILLLQRMIRFLLLSLLLATARGQSGFGISDAFPLDTLGITGANRAESISAAFDLNTRFATGPEVSAVSTAFPLDTRAGAGEVVGFQIGVTNAAAGGYLPGTLVKLKWGTQILSQGLTAADGRYVVGGLPRQSYTLVVHKTGYATRVLTIAPPGAGLTSAFNVALQPDPVPPPLQPVNLTPPASAFRAVRPPDPLDPIAPRLLVYDPLTRDFSSTATMNTGRMTIVMAHGWKPFASMDALEWARLIARAVQDALVTNLPNMAVWDWNHQANALTPPVDEAVAQGLYCGRTLLTTLGGGYAQHVHFIGHSLGTLVCKGACDYVHGDMARASANPVLPPPWDDAVTRPHVTLLDEAEVASIFGTNVITSVRIGWTVAGWNGGILAGINAARKDWKSPIPVSAAWVDNYISMVGLQHDEAVNICLTRPALEFRNPVAAHAYAYEWYRNSVPAAAQPPALGWRRSQEAGALFPPAGAGMEPGALWYEATAPPPQQLLLREAAAGSHDCQVFILGTYALTATGRLADAALGPLDEAAAIGARGAALTGRYVSNAAVTLWRTAGTVRTEVSEKLGLGWDAFLDGAQDIADRILPDANAAQDYSLGSFTTLRLKNTPPAPDARVARNGNGNGNGVTQPRAWLTLTLPPDAGLMAFDFKVTGDPADDCVDCAINDQNLFSLPLALVPDATNVSTDLIDVSAYAGQQVEIMFALAGGTSTDAELGIDGLRLITLPPPVLTAEALGNQFTLRWPAAATGWGLEASDTLAAGTWQPVSTASASVTNGEILLPQVQDRPRKFYRLRRM
jgi:hypothetical protein